MLEITRCQCVSFLVLVAADDREPEPGVEVAELPRGREDLEIALLAYEAADEPHNDVVRLARAQLGACRGALDGRDGRRIEPSQVDAVPEQRELARRHADATERLQIFLVLHELRLRAHARGAFRAVNESPFRQGTVGLGVQAVHGVHDHGDACRSRRDAAVEPRLRIVGVHDRRPELPQQLHELEQRSCVACRCECTGRMAQRHVSYAASLDRLDEWTGGRDADDLETVSGKGFELRSEEPFQADVGRRDVGDERARRGHDADRE